MAITHVELHAPMAVELTALACQFPGIGITQAREPRPDAIDGAAWRSDDFDFWAFDRRLDDLAAGDGTLGISAPRDAVAIAREILTRAQRVAPRRAGASTTAWFRRVLELHREMHDLAKPLVRADYDHALDTWQWTLRLDPQAAADVQLGALCHDLERLESEADRRIEHGAADYQAFKDAHARGGARLAADLFSRARVPADIAARAIALIETHERPSANPASRALNDADALSFFALNSPGYLRYFGPAQTARKVTYSFARMSRVARRELPALRLPAPIREQLTTSMEEH
jgi:hypothetical protein